MVLTVLGAFRNRFMGVEYWVKSRDSEPGEFRNLFTVVLSGKLIADQKYIFRSQAKHYGKE